ncbi:methylamine utilization protein MauE [Tumebacillus sp. BK434]|uniref:MauE/DoxX family redox-associated membrane protein n=1 Tax=Tumebacillus sp. BK434 TaxID=2512169 RepID=UPI00104B3CC8|nr:MauE/DoxX family redox-associated membrane protein [Tumebacillus sp. BK434]TCP52386.1 methylamine utilization protein MauE [Tumebacillus sp. BK434]
MESLLSVLLVSLSGLFFVSAVFKLLNLNDFMDLVAEYAVLPRRLSRVYGAVLPFAEGASAVLLLVPGLYGWGALLMALSLVSFAMAVRFVMRQGRVITCGCQGKLLDSKADGFTLGKIGFLGTMLAVTALLHDGTVVYSLPTIALGSLITLLVILMQKVWTLYANGMQTLKRS